MTHASARGVGSNQHRDRPATRPAVPVVARSTAHAAAATAQTVPFDNAEETAIVELCRQVFTRFPVSHESRSLVHRAGARPDVEGDRIRRFMSQAATDIDKGRPEAAAATLRCVIDLARDLR